MAIDSKEKPHSCNCNKVSRCGIFVHPSSKVQSALNNLMDAMAEYDDLENASSLLIFESNYQSGIFKSITKKDTK